MGNTDNNVQITLYNEAGDPVAFNVERVFVAPGGEQQYCCVWPADGREEPVFLRCELTENEDDGTVTLSVATIPTNEEHAFVVHAYMALLHEDMEEVREDLSENEDFIILTDKDGNQIAFIVHTIFKDELSGREYIAVQQVDDAGEIENEISIFRYNEYSTQEHPEVEMIRSDMEYDRARQLLMNLIEGAQ